jgi:hypothetical protein
MPPPPAGPCTWPLSTHHQSQQQQSVGLLSPELCLGACLPRYTGYIQGLTETYKKTPVMAQLETKAPEPASFLHTRTCSPPKASPMRDPCNFPENFKKEDPDNLWPSLQATAKQVGGPGWWQAGAWRDKWRADGWEVFCISTGCSCAISSRCPAADCTRTPSRSSTDTTHHHSSSSSSSSYSRNSRSTVMRAS